MLRAPLHTAMLVAALCAACGGDTPSRPSPTPTPAPTTPVTPPPPPVAPTFTGHWVGTYRLTRCTDSGTLASQADLCGSLNEVFGDGSRSAQDPLPVQFVLLQTGQSVTANWDLGSIQFGNTQGTIQPDGSVRLTSATTVDGLTMRVTWTLQTLTTGILRGTQRQVWTHGSFDGEGLVDGEILSVTRN